LKLVISSPAQFPFTAFFIPIKIKISRAQFVIAAAVCRLIVSTLPQMKKANEGKKIKA
jgi:hypothetical protein